MFSGFELYPRWVPLTFFKAKDAIALLYHPNQANKAQLHLNR